MRVSPHSVTPCQLYKEYSNAKCEKQTLPGRQGARHRLWRTEHYIALISINCEIPEKECLKLRARVDVKQTLPECFTTLAPLKWIVERMLALIPSVLHQKSLAPKLPQVNQIWNFTDTSLQNQLITPAWGLGLCPALSTASLVVKRIIAPASQGFVEDWSEYKESTPAESFDKCWFPPRLHRIPCKSNEGETGMLT